LQAIASAGGGRYSELTAGSTTRSPWAAVEGSEFARKDDALGERWKDAGPWLLLVLLPLVAFSFRRGLLFVMPLLILPGLLLSTDAKAGLWDDLWATRDQQAQAALRDERAADAAVLAKNPEIAGEAFYRSGDFVNAGQSWSQAKEGKVLADSHYNRGNSMTQIGEFESAIAAYDAALALDPEMEDATFNRDLVEQMKQQQEQQEQQEQQDSEGESDEEQSGDESEESKEQSSEDQQEGEQGEEESEEPEEGEESGEPTESEMEQNWSEEDAQAMEQWLRRIPDDPGGLLRRKFRNQHERRGAPADESETW
jgi:Ca-activated chloride channel family protein